MKYKLALCLAVIILQGFLIPEPREIPVKNATASDWNKDSFWYEPWGTSGVHKGVDIFAKSGTPVLAATNVLILYSGNINKGGNVILGLGPKWRLHYFAHLGEINSDLGLFASSGESIGSVGDSGNAKGKPSHLHFSILSLIPLPWLMDGSSQGYKKSLYLNPINYFSTDSR